MSASPEPDPEGVRPKLLVEAFLINALEEGAEEAGVEAGPDGHEVYTVIAGERRSSVAVPQAIHAEMLARLRFMAGESGAFELTARGKAYPVQARFRTTVLGDGVVLSFRTPS
ncbi:MAG: hypothetical protein HY928_07025 [Elusimicrobia bacterium]|nr:hypothetical protein [Elusimicrobiota bacterium]